VLVLSKSDVASVLTLEDCIEAVQGAQIELSANRVVMPVRMTIPLAEGGEQNLMPAWLGATKALGVKSVTFFPRNGERELPPVIGLVLLLEHDTGRPLAIMDGTYLTAVRTAAASAVATRALAVEGARVLTLIGAGTQARSHLAAMIKVRPIREVRVVARSLESAERFAGEQRGLYPEITIEAFSRAEEALSGADIVCTVSLATEPVLAHAWLKPGCHINAVGSHSPTAREVDGETMATARVVVDSRDANLAECGDCIIPIQEGLFGPEHVSDEIGEVLAGVKPGRREPFQITVYQSCGLAVQDVATARLVYEQARVAEIGLAVDWNLTG
jgi:ornithine cyclodeaminase